MKALSLTQPWAQLVALGHKKVETRSWSTRHAGQVAIHAAKGFPASARRFAEEERALCRLPERIPCGAIVALATLMGCRRTEDVAHQVSALERHLGDYTPGRFAWFLSDVVALGEPVACRGSLGLWTVPYDVAEAVRRAALS